MSLTSLFPRSVTSSLQRCRRQWISTRSHHWSTHDSRPWSHHLLPSMNRRRVSHAIYRDGWPHSIGRVWMLLRRWWSTSMSSRCSGMSSHNSHTTMSIMLRKDNPRLGRLFIRNPELLTKPHTIIQQGQSTAIVLVISPLFFPSSIASSLVGCSIACFLNFWRHHTTHTQVLIGYHSYRSRHRSQTSRKDGTVRGSG